MKWITPGTCVCECDKDCEIGECLENSTYMKSLIDDLLVTCDDTPASRLVSPSDGINYWLIAFVLLSIASLLLFVAIVVKYCMKRGLTILCLLSY